MSKTKENDIFLFGSAAGSFHGYYPGFSTERASPTGWFWSVVKMLTGNPRGTVKLRSANPRDVPQIDFNFFAEGEEQDLPALAEGVEFGLRMFNSTGAPYAPFKILEPKPGVELRQSIKDETFGHHATSTCRMGPRGDSDYCVDSKFRVNGVDGLRVVDASIFPQSPGAMPVLPTMLLGQKASETLLEDLSCA